MASFADRLAWLLAVVPRHPDRPAEHFEMNELETALTATDDRAGRSLDGTRGNPGRDWLHAAREGAIDLADDRHRPYLNALEDTLRLPRGYFLDDALATTTDELITLAAELRAGGTTIIGPCRTAGAGAQVDDVRRLTALLRDTYRNRTGSGT